MGVGYVLEVLVGVFVFLVYWFSFGRVFISGIFGVRFRV